MRTVSDVLVALEKIAPARWAFGFDRVGLQVGNAEQPVTKVALSLDRSLAAVAFAKANGCEMLVSHHPLFFPSTESTTSRDHVGKTVLALTEANIAFAAAHTNWDSAPGGINDALVKRMGLVDSRPLGSAAPVPARKIAFGIPAEAAEAAIDACAASGAGVLGAYRRCALKTPSVGTFEPQEGANPAIGKVGSREEVEEVRVEMTLRADQLAGCLKALRAAHPYEEPAIDVYVLQDLAEMPNGRWARLAAPVSLKEFAAKVDQTLNTRSWTWGDPDRKIETLAVIGGGADAEAFQGLAEGVDLFWTGEVRQHVAVEHVEMGMALMASGHYATEQPGVEDLAPRLMELLPDIEVKLFEPAPGFAGRPF